MKRFCVYSAIVGNYDEIKQPIAFDADFDFLLFSDSIVEKQIGVWRVLPIRYHNETKTKVARWVKTHPEQLLADYDYSVWVDASVMIRDVSFYSRVKELSEQNVVISTIIHPDWTCPYQEMLHIMYLGWESERTTLEWGHYMRKEGYPRNLGTFETRVLFRNHSNKTIRGFDELWWDCIKHYSRRDQYSFRFCLWKKSMGCAGFLPVGYDAHDNPFFIVENHSGLSGNDKVVDGGKKGWILKYYCKHADKQEEVSKVYYWIYGRKYYHMWWRMIGQVYRMKHLFLYVLGSKNVYLWELEKK